MFPHPSSGFLLFKASIFELSEGRGCTSAPVLAHVARTTESEIPIFVGENPACLKGFFLNERFIVSKFGISLYGKEKCQFRYNLWLTP